MIAGDASTPRLTFFHLDGISEDVARGDILACMAIAKDTLSGRSKSGADYGLLGALIGGLLGNAPTNRMRNSTMQKCMSVRGYQIYAVEQERWAELVGVDEASRIKPDRIDSAVVDGLARIASGPLPTGQGLSQ